MTTTHTTYSSSELITKVNQIFTDLFEVEEGDLQPEKHLYNDIGLDSLDTIDLVVSFQKEFRIKPPTEELQHILTLGDVYKLVQTYYAKAH